MGNKKEIDYSNKPESDVIINHIKKRFSKGLNTNVYVIGLSGCQPKGSKVLMSDGTWKDVSEIKVGDMVMSPQKDNTVIPCKVNSIKEYKSDIYKVTNKKGDSYRCASEHMIVSKITVAKKCKGKVKTHQEMKEYMAKDYNKLNKYSMVNNYLMGNNKLMNSPAYELPEKKFIFEPYLIGLLLGDGHILKTRSGRNDIGITSIDEEIIKYVNNFSINFGLRLDKNYESYRFRTNKNFPQWHKLCNEFLRLGLTNKKSGSKFIPEEYLLGSIKQRLDLLAGLIDTDGHKDKRCDNYEYVTKSEELAKGIYKLCKCLGFGVSINKCKKSCVYNGIKKVGDYYRFNISPQDYIIPCKIKRKQGLLRNSKWKDIRASQINVTKEKTKEQVYGFNLYSPSGWFITNDWLITHNTGKSSTSIRLSELLNEEGKEERKITIVDSLLELLRAIRNSKEGDIIIIEEVSVLFPSRRAMAKENVNIGKVMDTCRKKRLIIISNAPIWGSIDSHMRAMGHLLVETLKINKTYGVVVSKFHRLQTNPMSGKTYRHTMQREGRDVSRMFTRMPDKERWDNYEDQKDKFMENLYLQLEHEQNKKKKKLDKEMNVVQPTIEDLNEDYLKIHHLVHVQKKKQKDVAVTMNLSTGRISQIVKEIKEISKNAKENPQNSLNKIPILAIE